MIAIPEWIPYRRGHEILRVLSDAMKCESPQRGLYVLAGPADNGKTALGDRLQQLHPASVNETSERSQIPVLALDMTPTPSFSPIFRTALRKLGTPVIPCPLDRAVAYLGGVLAGVRTRLIVLDDAQHILTGIPSQRSLFLSFWRDVAAQAGAALLLVGSAQVLELAPDAELLPLPAWPLDDEFERMVQALAQCLSPERALIGAEDIPALYSICAGRLGVLVATMMALVEGGSLRTVVSWDERFQRTELVL
ncbi:MAG: TniB family NTP-binding protein [Acidobacteriota bacterium]|nr:TniB family NTP-binding protein [Acidobacteriota bacterium]